MPVIINSETGLAEDLPQEHADVALQQGSHELPLNDPEGNPVTAPVAEASNLLSQGYTQPHPEQLQHLLDYSKYSGTGEQIKTALEGAGVGSTFGLSTGLERGLGVKPEEIRARAEINPGVHQIGEMLGLGASALIPGIGEAGLLGKASAGIAKAVGLGAAESTLAKVGSSAVKNAIETAMVSSGNEVSKMLSSDPNQSLQTAMVDVGLGSLMGGALGAGFGSVNPLWKMAQGNKVVQFLNVIKNKANGLEKDVLPDATIGSAAEKAGIELAPEIRSALSENPEAQGMFQTLQESTTKAGKEAQASFHQFREQTKDAVLGALGKNREFLDSLDSLSSHEAGSNLQSALTQEIRTTTDPLSEQFAKIKEKFKLADIDHDAQLKMGEDIAKYQAENGYGMLEGTPQGSLLNKVYNSIPKLKTLEDLRKLQTQVSEQAQNPEMWGLGKGLKSIFREVENDVVESKLAQEAPNLVLEHKAARAAYKNVMDTIDNLNDRLHVGRYAGPESFLTALKEMNPEVVLNRLTPKNDAGLLTFLSEKFPGLTPKVKENYLHQALKAGAKNAGDEAIRPNMLFKHLDSWSPELRQFALPEGAGPKLEAVKGLIEALPAKMNTSGTAKTLDALWEKAPGGALSMVSLLTGHNPAVGFVIGQLGRLIGREVPDAIKLATLKFLGSDLPVNSTAFKMLAEMVSASAKGNEIINSGIKNLFKAGAHVLPQSLEPSAKEKKNLEKAVEQSDQNPSHILNIGGETAYYLPDHGTAMGSLATRAVQYLKSLKPSTAPMSPLGPNRAPSQVEIAQYDRALTIAQQPLTILKHVKDTTLTQQDVATMKAIYPDLYTGLVNKVTQEMIGHVAKGNIIPYKNRIALSMFLGQPLDHTLSGPSIQSLQTLNSASIGAPETSVGQTSGAPGPARHSSFKNLGKMADNAQTPAQSRASNRLTRV